MIELLDPLVEAGYCMHLRKINVANYGIPQLRKRVVALGVLGGEPSFPSATHSAYGAPGTHRVGRGTLPRGPSLMEGLADLPAPTTLAPGEPSDHHSRPLRGGDLQRARALRPGQTMRDLPDELQHPSYRRRALRRVQDGTPSERRGGPPAGLRRLRGDEPSKAITGAAVREFLHPEADRPLTLRECAQLQTFPEGFEFEGNLAEKAVLVGNAVPPAFAQILGQSLLPAIAEADPHGSHEGGLISFVPSVFEGGSPALRAVVGRVRRRYGPAPDLPIQEALWA